MGTVIPGTVVFILLALYFMGRRRTRLSRTEQYMSPSGLRWLRGHIPILLIGGKLSAVVMRLAM
jgi:hypothetical protein